MKLHTLTYIPFLKPCRDLVQQPNSSRSMEVEVMTRINHMVNVTHAFAMTSENLPNDVAALINTLCSPVSNERGTLKSYNFTAEEMLAFREMSLSLSTKNVTGAECFPGELSGRYYEANLDDKTADLLKEYYEVVYADCGYTFDNRIDNIGGSCIYVSSTILRASNLRISDETFGSSLSGSDLNACVIACFLDNEDNVSYYLGEVACYFRHRLTLPERNSINTQVVDHYLCLIDWYKPTKHRGYFDVQQCTENDFEKPYHAELWGTKCTRRTHESILPVQRLICRFVKGKYRLKGQKDELNVVIPLRRKFSL